MAHDALPVGGNGPKGHRMVLAEPSHDVLCIGLSRHDRLIGAFEIRMHQPFSLKPVLFSHGSRASSGGKGRVGKTLISTACRAGAGTPGPTEPLRVPAPYRPEDQARINAAAHKATRAFRVFVGWAGVCPGPCPCKGRALLRAAGPGAGPS